MNTIKQFRLSRLFPLVKRLVTNLLSNMEDQYGDQQEYLIPITNKRFTIFDHRKIVGIRVPALLSQDAVPNAAIPFTELKDVKFTPTSATVSILDNGATLTLSKKDKTANIELVGLSGEEFYIDFGGTPISPQLGNLKFTERVYIRRREIPEIRKTIREIKKMNANTVTMDDSGNILFENDRYYAREHGYKPIKISPEDNSSDKNSPQYRAEAFIKCIEAAGPTPSSKSLRENYVIVIEWGKDTPARITFEEDDITVFVCQKEHEKESDIQYLLVTKDTLEELYDDIYGEPIYPFGFWKDEEVESGSGNQSDEPERKQETATA